MEFFIAGIIMFGGNFAPRSWAFCQGQLLPIASNQSLFALIGTAYGGDGRTTFALPDLRYRAPIGFGNAPGIGALNLGQRLGAATHTLSVQELAGHSHTATVSAIDVTGTVNVTDTAGGTDGPGDAYLAPIDGRGVTQPYSTAARTGTATLASDSLTLAAAGGAVQVDNTGSNSPISMMQPSLAMNYIIALDGIFPSRS